MTYNVFSGTLNPTQSINALTSDQSYEAEGGEGHREFRVIVLCR